MYCSYFFICNYVLSVFSQTNINNFDNQQFNVFIVGLVQFDSLIFIWTNQQDTLHKKTGILENYEATYVIAEKKHIDSFLVPSLSRENFRYMIFNDYCFEWYCMPSFVYHYIMPYAPEYYKTILQKTYPNEYNYPDIRVNSGVSMTYKTLNYMYFSPTKFLLVMVRLSCLNQLAMNIHGAERVRFPYEKTVAGMYIKVLIPLLKE
jgi:hypothetical protein